LGKLASDPVSTLRTFTDPTGRITSVGDNSSRYAYGYDNADRLTGRLETTPCPGFLLR